MDVIVQKRTQVVVVSRPLFCVKHNTPHPEVADTRSEIEKKIIFLEFACSSVLMLVMTKSLEILRYRI